MSFLLVSHILIFIQIIISTIIMFKIHKLPKTEKQVKMCKLCILVMTSIIIMASVLWVLTLKFEHINLKVSDTDSAYYPVYSIRQLLKYYIIFEIAIILLVSFSLLPMYKSKLKEYITISIVIIIAICNSWISFLIGKNDNMYYYLIHKTQSDPNIAEETYASYIRDESKLTESENQVAIKFMKDNNINA